MNRSKLFTVLAAGAVLAACDSGDITLAPTNVDNSNQGNTVTNPPASATNPCASYQESGQTFEGTFNSDGNCVYDTSFVSDTRPITVTTIRFPNFGGLHIFEDSLFIGDDVSAAEASTGQRIPQEGEGTRLIIDAGNTMVFNAADSYVRIARGSQIFAEGTPTAPIIFTADDDAILGTATESDRGLWGGLQLNGNGRTNRCDDGTGTGSGRTAPGVGSGNNQFAPTSNNVHGCHAIAEGRPATYGGNNNAENSGVLTYVVVKHAGFEVVDGNELNAITLNGVGSGTFISHVQTYTSLDDGFEMFGGAVNLDHIVALNVGDDSIDYSQGYNGLIQYAVVLDTSGANRCIEGDNTGENTDDDFTPTTKLWISNLTCIQSTVASGAGTNPSSKGDSEGVLFREGAFFEMYNSIVTSHLVSSGEYQCDDGFEAADSEGPFTIDAIEAGAAAVAPDALTGNFSRFASNVIACEASEASESSPGSFANSGISDADLLALLTQNNNTNNLFGALEFASLLENNDGAGNYDRGYTTAASIEQTAGAEAFVQTVAGDLADLNDAALFPVPAATGFFETPTYVGGATATDDWLAGWTVGFDLPLAP